MEGRAIRPESIIVHRTVAETWIGDYGVAIKSADSAVRIQFICLKLAAHKLENWNPIILKPNIAVKCKASTPVVVHPQAALSCIGKDVVADHDSRGSRTILPKHQVMSVLVGTLGMSPTVTGIYTGIVFEYDVLCSGRLRLVPVFKRIFGIPNDIVAVDYVHLFGDGAQALVCQRRVIYLPKPALLNQDVLPGVPELDSIAKSYCPVGKLLSTTNKTDVASAHSYVASVTASYSVCRAKTQMQIFIVHKLATTSIDNVSPQGQFDTAILGVRRYVQIDPHLTCSRVVPEISILVQVLRSPLLRAAFGSVIENDVPDVHIECAFGANLLAETARAHTERCIWERRGRCLP